MNNDQCIILDLDNTLIYTFDSDELEKIESMDVFNNSKYIPIRDKFYTFNIDEISKSGVIKNSKIFGIKRPHLDEFLTYCFKRFKVVGVWTAGTYFYGHGIVSHIFKDIGSPHIILTRDECTGPLHNLEKPIQKMIDITPGLGKYMHLENTFVIDDRNCSFTPNHDNGILIPAYQPHANYRDFGEEYDNNLIKLIKWFELDTVRMCNDVRDLLKSEIFDSDISKFDYNEVIPNITPFRLT
jgi:TFIIF-interacting CTD phosphatase-like protein